MSPTSIVQDVRYTLRSLAGAPFFALAAVGTLALGIGASTATFSVVHAVLLKEMPYANPERLVIVWPEVNANKAMTILAAERMASLESVSGMTLWTLTLTGLDEPREITANQVSPGHFELLGVRPALGRSFTEAGALPALRRWSCSRTTSGCERSEPILPSSASPSPFGGGRIRPADRHWRHAARFRARGPGLRRLGPARRGSGIRARRGPDVVREYPGREAHVLGEPGASQRRGKGVRGGGPTAIALELQR